MKQIAYKSKTSILCLLFGTVGFAVLAVLSFVIQPSGWIVFSIISVVLVAIFFIGFCLELKNPSCIIKKEGNLLWICSKKQWYKVQIIDLQDVKFDRTRFGRIPARSGTLTIITNADTFKLYNVKNVQSVALYLRDLIIKSNM